MPKIIAAVIAIALIVFGVYEVRGLFSGASSGYGPVANNAAVDLPWVAAAPGRVEPKSGEVRIGAAVLGRVADVLVKVDDEVEEGQLLVQLEDDEERARLSAAEAEAQALRKDKDSELASSRDSVIKAEDAVYSSERAVTGAKFELDYALAAKRQGSGSAKEVADARKRLISAKERLQRDRVEFVKAQSKSGLAAPNRAEAAISTARAQVTIAEALLEKTRIRAPITGTILQANAKAGEMVAPSAEQPLISMGDMSIVRVKAEVDEGDVSKIKLGQRAFVRTVSYPGRDFEGKVSKLSPSLGTPRIGQRGPRRTTDVEVLEITVDLEGNVPLLPGMRVDAFFRE